MNAGFSAMSANRNWTDKLGDGVGTMCYRCSVSTCKFRLLLHRSKAEYSFALGKKGVDNHSDHDLKAPSRSTAYIVRYLRDAIEEQQGQGRNGLDLVA